MPEKAALITFLVAALALNIAPGPDMLYVIGRSVGQGRKAGIVSSLGVFVGCWVHILLPLLGSLLCLGLHRWRSMWCDMREQLT